MFAVGFGLLLIALCVRRARLQPSWLALAVVILGVVLFDLELQLRVGRRRRGRCSRALMTFAVLVSLAPWVPLVRARVRPGATMGAALLILSTVGFLASVAFNERLSDWSGRSAGFSGRLEFWRASVTGFRERPWFGWGWLSAWRTYESSRSCRPRLSNFVWSHSAYLDLALGGGIVAVALAVVLAVLGVRSAEAVVTRSDLASCAPLALVAAVAVGCTQESFFLGSYFLTALLVAGLCASVRPIGVEADDARTGSRAPLDRWVRSRDDRRAGPGPCRRRGRRGGTPDRSLGRGERALHPRDDEPPQPARGRRQPGGEARARKSRPFGSASPISRTGWTR